jgi:hypothetical protein
LKTQTLHIALKGNSPFGSPLVGRTYEAETTMKYRFALNGQEKDDEIYGTGNATTAEYWELDTRLGHRWNLDPVTKPWQSSYSCFSDNPIRRVDPNGDDDFFGADGKFQKSTKTKTNNIYIMTVVNNKQVPVLLSKYKFETTEHGNGLKSSNQIIANIIGHYVNDKKQEYGVATDNLPDTKMFFSPSRNAIFANLSSQTNTVDPMLNDFNNLKSLVFHENMHEEISKKTKGKEKVDDGLSPTGTRNHLKVYFAQINDKTFENTTDDFKQYIFKNMDQMIVNLDVLTTTKPGTSTDEVKTLKADLQKVKDKYKSK